MGKSTLAKQIISKFPRFLIVDPSWEYGALGTIVHDLRDIEKTESGKIIFQSTQPHDVNEFNKLCQLAFSSSNFVLLIDEVHLYASPYEIPVWLKNLVVMGRKKGIGVITVSQRPAQTHKLLISQANHIFVFNLFIDRDVDFFRGFIPNADQIITLPQYEYLYFDVGQNSLRHGKTNPM